ncbi:fibrobacter succinogenes major paralogous domain [Candidatus Ornithobacterium hominis]|uniref:Fibrobacter succinogenes major paralogous domain n=1 Tax=Candidatus Ornithobacterium hominis TaxID=2497989 RepID=A0A383U0S3_9FLAO|nr:FISUMP domain-containing protein [Candidatus Ornithobacterium hominis]MCT7904213.1 fibrobacter succinogenes major paralogous domain-containing protein [Candidatus Ornithobacterium hominis]SZD72876.1 fibrobacter succinogenes major paralogous domain [Candidatus Ornithobacterium hominis]
MKKLLLSFVVLPGALAMAQVGINTDEPKAMLDIRAKGDQEGNLRIQHVKEEKSTQWLLIWDEKDQMVKRTSLSDLKWDMIVDKGKINYIRGKQSDRADEIIKKIKQCAPENILFDKLFGISGKHDFVYCATTVTGTNYIKTWLNLNLGAEYANINSPDFNPTVNKTGTDAHNEAKTYGSLYQWQRASDGHEFRNSEATKEELATNWRNTGEAAGKFIIGDPIWVRDGLDASGSDLELWRVAGDNNPCPLGYHVPTIEQWQQFFQAVTDNNFSLDNSDSTGQIWTQNKLPNLAAASFRHYESDLQEGERFYGFYWSSSAADGSNARYVNFHSERSSTSSFYPASGYSVRCIKD